MKVLDVGCGIGGPMRTIATASGAEITGITINAYQVEWAKYHNQKVSLHIAVAPLRGSTTYKICGEPFLVLQ